MISEELEKSIKEIFQNYGDIITEALKEALAQSSGNATGTLNKSISFKVGSDENSVTLEIYAEEYFKFWDNGRAAGKMPPLQSIIAWISAKGIDVPSRKPGTRYGGQLESKGVISRAGIRRGKSAIIRRNVKISNEQFAFAIARNISKRGIVGKGILKPIILNITDDLTKKLSEAIKQSIENDIHYAWAEGKSADDLITYTINF